MFSTTAGISYQDLTQKLTCPDFDSHILFETRRTVWRGLKIRKSLSILLYDFD